jgi:phosphoribosylglycinamide formyltransferase-1
MIGVVVLASHRGSNFEALANAIDRGRVRARILGVVADRESAGVLELARRRGIGTRVVAFGAYPSRDAWDDALARAVSELAPDVCVLAGFMRIVGGAFLARFGGRTLNVHPSLLPAFAGIDAPKQALLAGVRVTGCTVHVVDAGVDTGPILAQAAVPVLPGDDEASLHARIQRAEHALFPAVVGWIADGALELGPPARFVRDGARDEPALFVPPLDEGAP